MTMSLLRLALVLATFTCVCHRSFSARPLEEERLIGWMGEVPTNVSCRQFAPVAAATALLHLGSNLLGQVAHLTHVSTPQCNYTGGASCGTQVREKWQLDEAMVRAGSLLEAWRQGAPPARSNNSPSVTGTC